MGGVHSRLVFSINRVDGKGTQDHTGGVVGEGFAAVGLDRRAVLGRQAVLRIPVEFMRDHGDRPAAVCLAHAEQPVESMGDAFVVVVTGQDEERHQRPGVIGGVLVADEAAYVARLGLAGKDEFTRRLYLRVGAGHPVLLDQEAQVTPGFDQVDALNRVFVLAAVRPGAVRLLLLQDAPHFGMMLQLFDRHSVVAAKLPAGECFDGLVAARGQRR